MKKELSGFCPIRRHISFDQTLLDHPDEFFELHYLNLFVEVRTIVTRTFGSPKGPKPSPWLQEHSEQFLKFVELLARPEPHAGRWERLLRDEAERHFIIQAIIMKIIDTKVFSSLLFGADIEHHTILQSADASLVSAEGFRRSMVRAQTNRLYLGTKGGIPPLFWEEVDKLSIQVLAFVLPTFAWTSKVGYEPWEPTSVQNVYQSPHEVIAYAGWLNICTRVSPAIIVYNWLKPGNLYELDQVNLSQELYEFSKAMAQRRATRLGSDDYKMTARVKISVGPEIVRYKPAANGLGLGGVTKYTIFKPHVVYYQGRELDDDDAKTYVSLSEFIRELRDRETVPHRTALAIMAIMWISLWVLFTESGQNAWRSIR